MGAVDDRAPVVPSLLSIHNVFLLEHNIIADGIIKAAKDKLDFMGDKDKDEAVFQVIEACLG